MATNGQILLWLLHHAGLAAGNNLVHIATNPIHTLQEFGEWMNANRLTCFLIGSGALVIAVPPLIGFSAAGPVAGSIAAGWQAAIGNVVAGSLFATLQSLTMTGVLSAIGGWTIGGGIARFLSTRDWRLILAPMVHNFLHVNSLSPINDLRRILSELNDLTRALPADHTIETILYFGNNRQITDLIDDMSVIASRLEALIPNHDVHHPTPPANTGTDTPIIFVPGRWAPLIARGLTLCSELNVAFNDELALGQFDSEPEINRLLGELEVAWTNLSHMPPPISGAQALLLEHP